MAQLKITQVKSQIRCLKKHKRTMQALGLRHPNATVIHNDTPQIRGMIAAIEYLVRVEPYEAASPSGKGRA